MHQEYIYSYAIHAHSKFDISMWLQHLVLSMRYFTINTVYMNDPLSPLTTPQFGVENYVAMVTATK